MRLLSTLGVLALAAWGGHLSNPRVVGVMIALIAWLIVYSRTPVVGPRR